MIRLVCRFADCRQSDESPWKQFAPCLMACLPAQFPPVQTLHFNIRVKAALHCKLLSVFRRREPRPLFFLCMLINGIIVSSQLSDPDRFSPLVSCSRNPGTTLRWRPSRRRGPTPTRPATATTSSRPRTTSYSASPRCVQTDSSLQLWIKERLEK